MKREDIANIFEGATDEQINAVLNQASAEIGAVKSKNAAAVDALNQQVSELQTQATQRDTDLENLKAKLAEAQADAGKLTDAQAALEALQTKYTADQQAWAQKAQEQAYAFAVREKSNEIPFSCAAAKRDFERELLSRNLPLENGQLLGYDDVLKLYKEANPGAILDPKAADDTKPAPRIVAPSGGNDPTKKKSLSEIMREKNANPNMVVKFD